MFPVPCILIIVEDDREKFYKATSVISQLFFSGGDFPILRYVRKNIIEAIILTEYAKRESVFVPKLP
jgi:hypothetical protein